MEAEEARKESSSEPISSGRSAAVIFISAAVFLILFLGLVEAFSRPAGLSSPLTGILKDSLLPSGEEEPETVVLRSAGGENDKKENPDAPLIAPVVWCHPAAATSSSRQVIFNEIAWMGDAAGSDNEWIEIYNPNETAADLSGWQIIDKEEQITVLFPPASVLAPKTEMLWRRASADDFEKHFYKGNLKNGDEALYLFDDHCLLADLVEARPNWPAGESAARRSMERNIADFSWYTSAVSGGTPGAPNSLPPPVESSVATSPVLSISVSSSPVVVEAPSAPNPLPPAPASSTPPPEPPSPPPPPPEPTIQTSLVINEVLAGLDGNNNYEFVEIYNPNSQNIDLTGWSIKKRSSTGSESNLVVADRFENKIITAGGRLLIVSSAYNGVPPGEIVWPSSYSLAYTENAVILYAPSGEKIHEAAWNEIGKGQSWEWQGGTFILQDNPSPGQ